MAYDVRMRMPDGNVAWLRMAGRRPPPCVKCGAVSTRLCDWKLRSSDRTPPRPAKSKLAQTCSAPICDLCTSSPAPNKDLCPTHTAEWEQRCGKKEKG